MEYLTLILTVATVHFLFAASPGPNFVIVSNIAVSQSRNLGFLVGAGVYTATLTWATLTACGLGAIFKAFPLLYKSMYYISALYLLYLGAKMFWQSLKKQQNDQVKLNEVKTNYTPLQAYRLGFITNMTNPKSMAYYTSLFVLILPENATNFMLFLVVMTAFLVSALWYAMVVLFFTQPPILKFYHKISRYINGFTGGILLFFGIKLILSFKPQ